MVDTLNNQDMAARRLDFIDGLRAVAVFLVLGTHYLYHAHATCLFHVGPWHGDLFAPFQAGAVGVDLFLVLSGFCLYHPLVTRREGRLRPEPTLWEFACRRARRILPPYYASLVLFTLWQCGKSHLHIHVSDIAAPPTVGDFLAHLAMLQTLRPEWVYGINPVFWSLGLEWFLYLGFPIFVVCFRRFGVWVPLAAVTVLSLSFQALMVALPSDARGFFNVSLFARWPEFVLGMVAARLVAHGGVTRIRFGWQAAALASCALMALAEATEHHPVVQQGYNLLWGAAFFSLLLAGSVAHGPLHRALSLRPLVWLGVISYSVYLTHFPLMHLLAAVARHHLHSGLSFVVAWVFLFLPVSIGLGYLFHIVFERPFMGTPRPKARAFRAPEPEGQPLAALASAE